VGQSSRQTGTTANGLNSFDARPHPNPLPRGEGEAARVSRKFGRHNCSRRLSAVRAKTLTTNCDVRIVNRRRTILPLLGERAGVRAVVTTNFPASRITHHASRT
jgi:hypothetical protein